MSFKLRKSESVTAGIRRIAREEIENALELLADGVFSRRIDGYWTAWRVRPEE